MTTLGSRLKKLRDEYGLSQESFGHHIDISYVAVANIEKGKTAKPQSDTMRKIIEVYGTTEQWLETGKGEMLPEGKKELKLSANPADIYQDALYRELKADKEDWKQKYDQLLAMFSKLLDRGQLGKYKAATTAVRESRRQVAEA